VVRSGPDKFVEIEDLDGNAIYLWEGGAEAVPDDALASRASGEP
jgi:hypothetical protein